MKARTETEPIAVCHGQTEVNLVTALGFYSMFGSLESVFESRTKARDGHDHQCRSVSRSFAN